MPTTKTEVTEATKPEETPVDEKLVEKAVVYIRKTLAETLFKGATDVGDYVLKQFFGDDPEQVRSQNPHKNASFRSLSEKCGGELPIAKSWLYNAVSVAVMRRLLPAGDGAFKQLPPSHQAALLPLREPVKVEKIAERAVAKNLSVRALRDIVEKEVEKAPKEGERRGRPPTPVIVKTLNRSLKVFTLEGGKRSFTKAMVEELDEDQKKDALKSAQALAASLAKLIEKLEA
jgi:hypothetical protein